MNAFESFNSLQIATELKHEIVKTKRQILAVRYPDGVFTTEEHEWAIIEAARYFGIVLYF